METEETISVKTTPCIVCGKSEELTLPAAQVRRRQAGELVQAAFPEMEPDERELLISGTHPGCFSRLFPEALED